MSGGEDDHWHSNGKLGWLQSARAYEKSHGRTELRTDKHIGAEPHSYSHSDRTTHQ